MKKQVFITLVCCFQAMGALGDHKGSELDPAYEVVRSQDAQGYNFISLLEHASTQINLPRFDTRTSSDRVAYTGTCFSVEAPDTPLHGVFLVANFTDDKTGREHTAMSDYMYDATGDLVRQDVHMIMERIQQEAVMFYEGPGVQGNKLVNMAVQQLDPRDPTSLAKWATTISQDDEGVIHTVNFTLTAKRIPIFNSYDPNKGDSKSDFAKSLTGQGKYIDVGPGEPLSVCRFDKVYYEHGVEAPEEEFRPAAPKANPYINLRAPMWMASL